MRAYEGPAKLGYEITALLTWSTSVSGYGNTIGEARQMLMAEALNRLTDRHLSRLQEALAPELTRK